MQIRKYLERKLSHRRSGTDCEIQASNTTATCLNRLRNMKQIGFSPREIVDCGASVGHWSLQVSQLFPGSKIVAIEPNPLVAPTTGETLSSVFPHPIIEECAVGANEGVAQLNIWDNEETRMSGSSIRQHVQGEPRTTFEVQLRKLDSICSKYNLAPDLVKLDLQGYELEALKGATSILETTEVFIIEFGVLQAYIDRTTPYELFDFMYRHNYCLYDIVDLIYRPHDNALAGGDFFFVKTDSRLREYRGYR